MLGLSALDIVVIVLAGGGAVLGLMRGFVTEVLSLMTWIFIVFALQLLFTPVSALLTGLVGTSAGAAVLAFVLIAGVVYFGGRMVASAIGERTRSSVLGPLDRALGFGFGGLKGLILASLMFLLIVLVTDTLAGGPGRRPQWIVKSRSYPLLVSTSGTLATFVERRRQGEPIFGNDSAGNHAGNGTGRKTDHDE